MGGGVLESEAIMGFKTLSYLTCGCIKKKNGCFISNDVTVMWPWVQKRRFFLSFLTVIYFSGVLASGAKKPPNLLISLILHTFLKYWEPTFASTVSSLEILRFLLKESLSQETGKRIRADEPWLGWNLLFPCRVLLKAGGGGQYFVGERDTDALFPLPGKCRRHKARPYVGCCDLLCDQICFLEQIRRLDTPPTSFLALKITSRAELE